MDLRLLWYLAVPLLLFATVGRVEIAPNDFWWHLRAGQYIWDHRAIPTTDLFSFTRRGQPWIYQAWLAQVAWYLIYTWGGASATILVHAGVIVASYWLLHRWLLPRVGLRAATLATFAAAAISVANWNVRPQTFSFPFFALLLVLLERSREQQKLPWGVLPLLALWANVHAAFIFGLVLLGIHAVVRAWQAWQEGQQRLVGRWALLVVGAFLATGLTPSGPVGMVTYFLGFLQSRVTMQANVEFMPITLRDPDGSIFFGITLLYLGLIVRHGPPRGDRVLALVGFGLGTLWSHRVISWYGFVLAPALAEALRPLPFARRPIPSGKQGLNVAILALMGILALSGLPWLRGLWPPLTPQQLFTSNTPVEAVAFLCRTAEPNARVYQEQGFGSYQVWACPRLPVFIDTRVELYPENQWRDYFAIAEGRFDWETVAARYGLNYLLLGRQEQPEGIRAAEASPCWEKVYEDQVAVLFRHRCAGRGGS